MRLLGNELHCIMHSDPGHAWLAVSTEMVRKAGVYISQHSYQRGKTSYLEEDCDAPAFIRAIEAKGYKVFITEKHADKRSPIRSYASFSLLDTFPADRFIFVHIGD